MSGVAIADIMRAQDRLSRLNIKVSGGEAIIEEGKYAGLKAWSALECLMRAGSIKRVKVLSAPRSWALRPVERLEDVA